MSYPTPMDVAEADDFAADDYCEDGCKVMGEHAVCSTSPSERLANICAALEEDLNESPFTREEWERLDAERVELLAANDGLAAEILHLRGLLREVLAADKYDWNMGLEDRVREACQP